MKTNGKFRGSDGSSEVHQGIDPFTEGFVRKSARQLAGKFGFKRQDRDEIEQRLYVKLAKHLHSADSDEPTWKAFVAKTVRRHIATMIRDNQAEKRDHRRASSIHVVVNRKGEAPVELADTIGNHQNRPRCGGTRSSQNLADLKLDLDASLNEMPPGKLREFCERLKYASISQVARDMGIPRTTLNAWLRKLRCRFEDSGLRDYV